MGYFDNEANVLAYEKMVGDADGRELVETLTEHLAAGSSVLELGMGPGKDLDLLSQHFGVTGSDSSQVFLDRYRRRNPDANLLCLDAETLDTDRIFDGIYSNKVLHHLSREGLGRSLRSQSERLRLDGIALHSLWYGDREENHHGLRFVYYTESTLAQWIPSCLEVIVTERYSELDPDDSMIVVLRKATEAH